MASKMKGGEPNLKIFIDNAGHTSDMEEGEVEDSSEDELPVKRRKHHVKERQFSRKRPDPNLDPSLFPTIDRPLPSPVESDDEHTLTVDMDDLETFGVTKLPRPKIYENKPEGNFELGFDPTSEEALKRRVDRAKRFGITPGPEVVQINDEKVKKLYDRLGITSGGERGIRLDAVHLRGVHNMSTEDVFQYFQAYGPQSIEWIDDSSCNVLWGNSVAAARAILGKSDDPNATEDTNTAKMETNADENKENEANTGDEVKDVDGQAQEQEQQKPEMKMQVEEDDDELNLLSSDEEMAENEDKSGTNKSSAVGEVEVDKKMEDKMEGDIKVSEPQESESDKVKNTPGPKLHSSSNIIKRILPPGNWRIGHPTEMTKFLFMRFASKADRKLPGAERKSQYYKQYGNPNFGGMTGLISNSRKRKMLNHQYRQEEEEARRMVKKTEKFYHGIPEETTFDQHLREAKQANKLKQTKRKSDDGSDEEEAGDNYNQDGDQDDLSGWGRESDPEQEEDGANSNQEEELDLELELQELMKKAPVYRMGRMHADDVEDQLKAKKEAADQLTKQMMAASDARRQIDHNRYNRSSHAAVTFSTLHQHEMRRGSSDEDGEKNDSDEVQLPASDVDDTNILVVEGEEEVEAYVDKTSHSRPPRKHHHQQIPIESRRQHRHEDSHRKSSSRHDDDISRHRRNHRSREDEELVRERRHRPHDKISSVETEMRRRHNEKRLHSHSSRGTAEEMHTRRRRDVGVESKGRRDTRLRNEQLKSSRSNVSNSDRRRQELSRQNRKKSLQVVSRKKKGGEEEDSSSDSNSDSESDSESSSSSSSSSDGSSSEGDSGSEQSSGEDENQSSAEEQAVNEVVRPNRSSGRGRGKTEFKYEKLRIHVDPNDV